MPAPLDVDWRGIAVLAASGATLEAISAQTGIKMNTLKARSAREGWKTTAAEIAESKSAAIAEKGLQPRATSGLEVAKNTLKADSDATKASLSRAVRKTSEHFEALDGEELAASALMVKATVQSAAQIHRWEGDDGNSRTSVVNVNLIGIRLPDLGPVVDVESE